MLLMNKREFNAVYHLLGARIFGKRFPLVVGWAITNRCNSKCLYCTCWKTQKEELRTEQIFPIIDELAKMGTQSINFTGGEPLIREDIGQIINYTKSKGINTGISSNGLLVAQKINDIRNIDTLILSFDGYKEMHDAQRCEGSYRYTLEAVRLAKENNIFTRLHTVLTKNNIEVIDCVLDFAGEQGVIVNFAVVEFDPFSEKENILALLPSEKKFKSAILNLIAKKKSGNKHIGNSLTGLRYFCNWPHYRKIPCCAGRIYCRIECNGDVFPCANLVNKVKPQNCIKHGFRNAFMSLSQDNCEACWCDTRIEMNYIYSFNWEAIYNAKTALMQQKCFGIFNKT